jgi:hypothetical protein
VPVAYLIMNRGAAMMGLGKRARAPAAEVIEGKGVVKWKK